MRVIVCAVVFFIMMFSSLAFAIEEPKELLAARRLVEERKYEQALKLYEGIASWVESDAGLAIEWARVFTYADKHPEAIAKFQQIIQRFPDRRKEIVRELADQYKWNSQLQPAIALYEEALRDNPLDFRLRTSYAQALAWDHQRLKALYEYDQVLLAQPDYREAMKQKADLLSWLDKLEESFQLYGQVLKLDPQDLECENGQAKILVWQGYHRKGIARYREILRTHPDNLDALEGLAFALHWEAEDVEAEDVLKKLLARTPQRRAAQDLFTRIKNARSCFVAPLAQYSRDNNRQTVLTNSLRVGNSLGYAVAYDGVFARQLLRKKNAAYPTMVATRAGVGAKGRLNAYLQAYSFLYSTHFSKADFNPVTCNTWFTVTPDDYWRFDLAYDRETFEDNDAIRDNILTNSGSLSLDFRLNRFWFFNAKYRRSYFSDDNRQNAVSSKIEYRLLQKPFCKLYYNYYYSTMGEPDLSHGYFNPHSIKSHALGLYTGIDLTKRLFAEAQISGGFEFQRLRDALFPESNHPVFFAGGGLRYRLHEQWMLSGRAEFFSTRPDKHNENGYTRKYFSLSVTYNFGAQPQEAREGTQPYRPAMGR
ncbi:MAG: hypothetical protein KBA46_03520 [Candidatus Omnitrophica bacterium]|nr:hypothetical protein [Candidatus Omnitrophota bacterium]